MFQFIKAKIYYILGIIISMVIVATGLMAYQSKQPAENNQKIEKNGEIISQPHNLLGFNSNKKLKSNLTKYQKIDSNQGSFTLNFDNFEIFNRVTVINTQGNISGLSPTVPERINETKNDISIEDTPYILIQHSNTKPFYGLYEYYLVSRESMEEFAGVKSYEIETNLLQNPNIDSSKYFETNVIIFRVRKTDDKERKDQLENAISNFKTLTRSSYTLPVSSNKLASPYESSNFSITQEYSEKHKAIDYRYNKEKIEDNSFYSRYGVVPLFAVCNGVASGTIDPSQALLVTLKCESGETYEYWHNQVNLVYTNQNVVQGEMIAIEGNTGNSDGAHLHLVYKNNNQERTNEKVFN